MCKGIKPVIWNFFRAEDIWDKDFIFNTQSEASELLLDDVYEPERYRAYIEDNYSLERHLEAMDKALEIE